MDVYILKSATEEQMEMMIMMMQMDKLPSELTESQSLQFSDHGTTNSLTTQHNFDNPNLSSSSTLLNPSPPLSFHHQEHQVLPSALSNIAAMTRLTHNNSNGDELSSPSYQNKQNSMAAMREMIFRIASMQPIHIDPESVKPPKRRNVKISKDPQSIAARHRRERISERIRILQRLVPGGTKMDTASMLDEAIHYVKFLKNQVQSLERAASTSPSGSSAVGFNGIISNANHSSLPRTYQYLPVHHQLFSPTQMLN